MTPPVRPAIEGAYLVAIFFTGFIFGILATGFKIAEGLGYMLRCFCMSMWLLSTKSGGLPTSMDARISFIRAISMGFYAISFYHCTRPYGLIVSALIAGRTAVSLGIDCYSTAGLNEFWLYLWALNYDILLTYLVSPYIRVELAVTVMVAIIYAISQMRLRKIVRDMTMKKEEKRQEEQEQKDGAKAEAVRQLQENYVRERMEWESKYGNQGADPGFQNIPELEAGSHLCAADEGNTSRKDEATKKQSISDSVVSYHCSDCWTRGNDGDLDAGRKPDHDEYEQQGTTCALEATGDVGVGPKLLHDAVTADDKSSNLTATGDSETMSVHFKGLSMVLSHKVFVRRAEESIPESQEALSSAISVLSDARDIDSDCHAIAAESCYQEIFDEEQSSKARGSMTLEEPETFESPVKGEDIMAEIESAEPKADVEKHNTFTEQVDVPSDCSENLAAESTDGSQSKQPKQKKKKRIEEGSQSKTDAPITPSIEEKPAKIEDAPTVSPTANEQQAVSLFQVQPKPMKEEPKRLDAETVKQLSRHTSRVVQSYRMNEWTKNLEAADIPELEPIRPFADTSLEGPEEVAAPVKVVELLQTQAVELRVSGAEANNMRSHDFRTGSQRKRRRSKLPRRLSGLSVSRSAMHPQANNFTPVSLSTLLANVTATKPQREETQKLESKWKGPPPLIAVREEIMQNRRSSLSLPIDPYMRHSADHSPTDFLSQHLSMFPIVDQDDDIPLSQRRAILRRQAALNALSVVQPLSAPARRHHSGAVSTANSPADLITLRELVREDHKERSDPLTLAYPPVAITWPNIRSSTPLIGQAGQCNASYTSIEDRIAKGMQRGDMNELHQEAIRRMQAKANKSVARLV
ncbi:hypothetical protein BJX99DRAFT_258323 [Aspergillus californicus]